MPGGYSMIGDLRIQESGGEIVSQSIGSKAMKTSATDSSTLEVDSSTGQLQIMTRGASLANGVGRVRVSKYAGAWIQGALVASSGAIGGVFQLQNTYGSDLIVTDVMIHITTASSVGSMLIDVGVGSADDANYDNLLDALPMTVAGVFNTAHDEGDNGGIALWKSNEYLSATPNVGGEVTAPTALVGFYACHVLDIST